MAPVMNPIDGEPKKRVVCTPATIQWTHANLEPHQCYFFDSDVSGFHYGPGHP